MARYWMVIGILIGTTRLRLSSAVAIWVLVSLLSFCEMTSALEPSRFLSQYGHTTWRIQDGELPGTIFPIGQSKDGYLWIGSQTGVLRFDGVRFVSLADVIGKPVPTAFIVSLLGSEDGDLWIGTAHGLSRLGHGDLIEVPSLPGGAHDLTEDDHHVIWFVTMTNDGNALCEIGDSHVVCHGKQDGLELPNSCCIIMKSDGHGNFLISTRDAVVRWSRGKHSETFPIQKKIDGGFTSNPQVVIDSENAALVGIADPGIGLGLQRLFDKQWKPFVEQNIDGATLTVQYLLRDRHNALWVGTADQGLYRFSDDRVDHFGSNDGLSSDYVEYLFEDAQGTMWVTTSQGLDRFRDLRVSSFTKREGVNSDEVDSVLATRDGKIWIGTSFTLDVLDNGRVHSVDASEGKPGLQVTSLLEDNANRLWVGIDNSLTIYAGGKFTEVKGLDGTAFGFVGALVEDSDRTIWAAVRFPTRKLIRIRDEKAVEEFADPVVLPMSSLVADAHDGIWMGLLNGDLAHRRADGTDTFAQDKKGNTIRKLLMADDGNVYGATVTGLVAESSNRLHRIGTQQGLPCDSVQGLIEDLRKTLWLQMSCGLVNVALSEIEGAINNPQYIMKVNSLSAVDGVRAGAAPFNTAARSADGRLWFANGYNLQTLDPRQLAAPQIPPVYVEHVVADRMPYSTTDFLRLPALTRDLEINYTAPELAIPQRVRFRYRLDGHDQDWIDAGARRQAFYTDLTPGNYEFSVAASEGADNWSPMPAKQKFSIAPAFYQTGWFAACAVVVLGAALWFAFTWQLRQMKARLRVRLDAQLSERERIARELHDTFLQGVQALMLRFQAAMEKIPPTQPARELMESALDHADRVLVEGRERVTNLRSLQQTTVDLPKALQDAGEELARYTSASFLVTVEGTSRELNVDVNDEVRAIAIEALTNAFHHSNATRVDLNISYSRRALSVSVVDDGHGFDVRTADATETAGHWGVRGMHERARKMRVELRISSGPNIGTAVELSIPAPIAYRKASRQSKRTRPT